MNNHTLTLSEEAWEAEVNEWSDPDDLIQFEEATDEEEELESWPRNR